MVECGEASEQTGLGTMAKRSEGGDRKTGAAFLLLNRGWVAAVAGLDLS
jgi:hypothetical protein